MFLFKTASFAGMPLASTADQLQPWMIAAIAAGALLALLLLVFAARRSRRGKGEDLREAMVAAKEEAAERMDATADPLASWEGLAPESEGAGVREAASGAAAVAPTAEPQAKASGAAGKKGRGKHAK